MADRKHLRLCGLKWHVVFAVPRELRGIIGVTQLKHSLKTDSLQIAQQRRGPIVETFKRRIAEARREGRSPQGSSLRIEREAIAWREVVAADDAWRRRGEDPMLATFNRTLIAKEAEAVAVEAGPDAARKYVGIATGVATPIALYAEPWLAELAVKDDTKDDHRLAVREFAEWAAGDGHSTLEEVSQKVAGAFVAFLLTKGNRKALGQPMHRATVRKRRSSLAAYWDWLCEREHLPEDSLNPWRRLKSIASRKGDARSRKRSFSDDEMRRLLYGKQPDAILADYIRIGALSGMRIDEIARLRVSDCAGGVFRVADAKTEAGDRAVPIHSALKALVARRVKGRAQADWLLPDHANGTSTRRGRRGDRSMAVSKRFGRFRKSVGVHDQREAERQSAVDFHSLRRWFIQQAKNRGFPEHVTAAVVGQKHAHITYGLYAKGNLLATLRECVEAVKLTDPKHLLKRR